MVFGNMGEDSGIGVGFTRNPSTGEKENYGEYLLKCAGRRCCCRHPDTFTFVQSSKRFANCLQRTH